MTERDVLADLMCFTRENLWPENLPEELAPDTPLLQLGVLDSLKTAILINYIRTELGTPVPALQINAGNFKDLRSVAALVDSLDAATAR